MAVRGIEIDKSNPPFLLKDFLFWIPNFSNVFKKIEEVEVFNKVKKLVEQKVFYSIWGEDFEYGMSLAIAHYLELRRRKLAIAPADDMRRIAGGSNYAGILSSFSIGDFSKSLDTSATTTKEAEAMFWNSTSYGAEFYAMSKTKAVPTLFVVTPE